jgi:O-antigen/teichoic acid export membrane protein
MEEKRRLVSNTVANGVAQAAAMLAGLVFMPMLVRGFGLTGYGLYMLAASVSSYAVLLDFGVGATLTKMIAEKSAAGDRDDLSPLISSGLAFHSVIGIAVAGIIAAMALGAGTIFRVDVAGAALLRSLLLVSAIQAVVTWPASTASHVLGGLQRYTLTARVAVAATAANVLATGVVVALGLGPLRLAVATASVSAAAGLANVILARRELPGIRVSLVLARFAVLGNVFGFSWAIFVVQLSTLVLYQQTDRIVLGVFVGGAAVGLYEAAGKFQNLIAQMVSFANSAVIPMASHLEAAGKPDALRSLFLRGTKYTLLLVTPIAAVLIILAHPLLLRWLGPEFAAYALAAQLLVSPHLLIAGGTIGDSMIVGMGRLPKRLPYAIAVTVGNLVLSIILVQRYGIFGVVIGTIVPYFLDFPIHMRFLLKEVDVSVGRWLREVVAPVYPLLLVPIGAAWLISATPLAESIGGIAFGFALALGAYWASAYALALTPRERGDVGAALAAARTRITSRKTT